MQVLETVFSWPFMFDDDDDGSDEVFNAVVDEHKIGVETKARKDMEHDNNNDDDDDDDDDGLVVMDRTVGGSHVLQYLVS